MRIYLCIRKLTQLVDKQNVDVLEESWNLMNRILNEPKDLFAVAHAMPFLSVFFPYIIANELMRYPEILKALS